MWNPVLPWMPSTEVMSSTLIVFYFFWWCPREFEIVRENDKFDERNFIGIGVRLDTNNLPTCHTTAQPQLFSTISVRRSLPCCSPYCYLQLVEWNFVFKFMSLCSSGVKGGSTGEAVGWYGWLKLQKRSTSQGRVLVITEVLPVRFRGSCDFSKPTRY